MESLLLRRLRTMQVRCCFILKHSCTGSASAHGSVKLRARFESATYGISAMVKRGLVMNRMNLRPLNVHLLHAALTFADSRRCENNKTVQVDSTTEKSHA